MSRAVKIMLPDPIVEQLQELADAADEALATLAAHMVRNGVALAAKDGKVRPLKPPPQPQHHRGWGIVPAGLSPTVATPTGAR